MHYFLGFVPNDKTGQVEFRLECKDMRVIKIDRDIKNPYGPQFPARMAYLQPDAAESLAEFQSEIAVSDIYRSPESSLLAHKTRKGALPPGKSAHNFGLAIDLDLGLMGIKSDVAKKKLDAELESRGWYCHRFDGRFWVWGTGVKKIAHECWHYNYLRSPDWIKRGDADCNAAVQRKILETFDFTMTPVEVQQFLKARGFYSGEVDGKIGPLSQQAVKAFRRAWKLPEDGYIDAHFLRLAVAIDRIGPLFK